LLLEAGPDLRASVPAGFHGGWRIPSDYDWGFESEPDDRGVVEELRRARILGGTSWSTRFALSGSPADFEGWTARGNAGWGFEDVLSYFRRLEADADFGDPDEGAVVDAEGSVYGTEGLSIVDASIMPAPPSGFPHLITIMIAERLSERIAALI
jgi:choline dehydrogenase-like flavoprotein